MGRLVPLALLLALVLASPAAAGNPHIHFSFGSGHWHHCHHPRPGFFFDYVVAPRPVYVVPAPVVQPVVPYVAPTYVPATPAPAGWTSQSQPAARPHVPPAAHSTSSTVVLKNPTGSGGPVAFVIDEATEVNLAPGQSHTLSSKQNYLVEFDRGGNFGAARKNLALGTYVFQVTERGWDLVPEESADRIATKPTLRRNELPGTTIR